MIFELTCEKVHLTFQIEFVSGSSPFRFGVSFDVQKREMIVFFFNFNQPLSCPKIWSRDHPSHVDSMPRCDKIKTQNKTACSFWSNRKIDRANLSKSTFSGTWPRIENEDLIAPKNIFHPTHAPTRLTRNDLVDPCQTASSSAQVSRDDKSRDSWAPPSIVSSRP